MSLLNDKKLRDCEKVMSQIPGGHGQCREDFLCGCCPHHRPDWKYRFCEYIECPYIKGVKTFWEETYGHGSE